jgi:hypothetical protein
MVFDRSPMEYGCLKTDSNRTTIWIDHNDIEVTMTSLGNQTERTHRGTPNLGFFITGDGASNEHKLKEKGLAYAMAIRNSTLQRGECSMAYGVYYMPSLAYGTPETTLSYK